MAVGTSELIQFGGVEPTNAFWSQSMSEYEFSIPNSSNIASINLNGYINGTMQGTVEVTATHKTTGITECFEIHVVPTFASELTTTGKVNFSHIKKTNDGFYMLDIPLSDVLTIHGISFLSEAADGSKSRNVNHYYDDWYIYAVENVDSHTYGLLKLRESECDGIDGDDAGVTVSFVNFDYCQLVSIINSNTAANSYALLQNLDKVTGPGSFDYDEALSDYFSRIESKAAYLIAEEFVQFIADESCVNGAITAPENYLAILEKIEEIDGYLDNPLMESNSRLYLLNRKMDLERVPNALISNNNEAGYPIYNADNQTIIISNPSSLTMFEKYAILAMHTGNVTFNSFAAEIQFHASALYDWKANHPDYYEAALRADMAIGEEDESGLYDEYYNLDSDIVQAQVEAHGEY